MGSHRDTPDNDEVNLFLVQQLEKSPEIELGQCAEAVPLMALICLQSTCRRASRSLMEPLRLASSRSARTRSKSPISREGVFSGTSQV